MLAALPRWQLERFRTKHSLDGEMMTREVLATLCLVQLTKNSIQCEISGSMRSVTTESFVSVSDHEVDFEKCDMEASF